MNILLQVWRYLRKPKLLILGIEMVGVILIFLAMLVSVCDYGRYEDGTGEVVIHTPVSEFLVAVEVADTSDARARGLMFREKLGDEQGMLFVFQDEGKRNFWMKNTLIPLDIIFLSSEKEIVGIAPSSQPCVEGEPCPHISSQESAQYVLEVHGGFVEENGIVVGDTVSFDYPFRKLWISCGDYYLK